MRFGLVDLVVFPSQALVFRLANNLDARLAGRTNLCNAERAPLVLPQQLQCSFFGILVVLGDRLEHGLGKLHVTVFVFAVFVSRSWLATVVAGVRAGVSWGRSVPGRVVDRFNVFLETRPFGAGERTSLLVAAAHVNVHGCGVVCSNWGLPA